MKPTRSANKKVSPRLRKSTAFPRLWYEALSQDLADLETMRISMVQRIDGALNLLAQNYHWNEAYLFGSVAEKGKFRRNSDIDIAVKGLNKYDYYEFVGEISSLLNKRVDVVLLEDCHFADSIRKKGIKWMRKSEL